MTSQAFLVKDLSVLAHSFSSTPKDQWEENVTFFSQRASMQQEMAGKYSDFLKKPKKERWVGKTIAYRRSGQISEIIQRVERSE